MGRRIPVKVRVWVTEQRQSMPRLLRSKPDWGAKLLTVVLLTSAIGLIVVGSRLAVQLMINPASLAWLSHFLPAWSNFSTAHLQTLEEIQAEVGRSGQAISQPIHLSTYPGMTQQQPGFGDLLVPVVTPQKHCASNLPSPSPAKSDACGQIVELRIYRSHTASTLPAQGMTYELIDRIAVTGPEELAAIAPLSRTSKILQGSTRTLPLTTLHFLDRNAPSPSLWFELNGEWKRGSRVLYGQVVQYDPQRGRLSIAQVWSSSAGRSPRWQQVTGDQTAELVIDQSVGLEPKFQVYQLQRSRSPAQSIALEAISLTESALSDRTYTHALLLARHGLWSSAAQRLKTVKQTGNWSLTAQAQLDLVLLHAAITQTQADRDWASPTQQILAQVIDGRWSKGLTLLQSARKSGYDIPTLLSTNADRLWQRIEAALRVYPHQADLQKWGMLMVAVRQNHSQAVVWLHQQPTASALTKQAVDETLSLLKSAPPANSNLASTAPPLMVPATPVSAPSSITNSRTCLVGIATPITTVHEADWLTPTVTPLALAPQQAWYRIEVSGLCNRQQWQRSPLSELKSVTTITPQTQQLWDQLGLADLQLQIMGWQGASAQGVSAIVKALQLHNGSLSLLAVGDGLATSSAPMVAITPTTLSWLQSSTTLTLAELAQQNSVWKADLIPQIWQDLQISGLIPAAAQSNNPLQTIGAWSVQLMELTGDPDPEMVLTIEPAHSNSTPRTVIFDQQSILYNDLQKTGQTLTAIVDPGDSQLPTLVVSTSEGLSLQQWSAQNLEFK